MRRYKIDGVMCCFVLSYLVEDKIEQEPIGTYRSDDYWKALDCIERLRLSSRNDNWIRFDGYSRYNYAPLNAYNEALVYFKKGRLRDVFKVAAEVL